MVSIGYIWWWLWVVFIYIMQSLRFQLFLGWNVDLDVLLIGDWVAGDYLDVLRVAIGE